MSDWTVTLQVTGSGVSVIAWIDALTDFLAEWPDIDPVELDVRSP